MFYGEDNEAYNFISSKAARILSSGVMEILEVCERIEEAEERRDATLKRTTSMAAWALKGKEHGDSPESLNQQKPQKKTKIIRHSYSFKIFVKTV